MSVFIQPERAKRALTARMKLMNIYESALYAMRVSNIKKKFFFLFLWWYIKAKSCLDEINLEIKFHSDKKRNFLNFFSYHKKRILWRLSALRLYIYESDVMSGSTNINFKTMHKHKLFVHIAWWYVFLKNIIIPICKIFNVRLILLFICLAKK